jgi:prefoldin beta subunit
MTEKNNIESEISQLQMIEQNLKNIGAQKQNMVLHLMESENSLKELKDYKGKPFKVIGPVMIEADSDSLTKELSDKIELLKVRIESMEKQEKSLKEQFEEIQKKLMASVKQSHKNN